jgi:hypothetical protein
MIFEDFSSFLQVISYIVLLIFVYSLSFILLYFLPFILAYSKNHINKRKIFIVNLFFGWTIIGWGICLIWANRAKTKNNNYSNINNKINANNLTFKK